MKIYTKTGDQGQTGLYGGLRVDKNDPRIEAYGTVDELNSMLGLVRSYDPPAEMNELLETIQNDLFDVGAELASVDPSDQGTRVIGAAAVAALEHAIDQWDATLEPLRCFILPAGSRMASLLHVARGIARRAERRLVGMKKLDIDVSPELLVYLNRLSDLLFVLARAANHHKGLSDVDWRKRT